MTAYYNEIDPFAAQWLRNLIDAGHIAPGHVDTRSIEDVTPHELAGYTQCHFFAGTGGWSLALRLAGWPDDRPVWTGSCPCQPFSAAGKGAGFDDERHLWPTWFHLIEQCRPAVVFGEQVAAAVGHQWLDGVCADLEGQDYAVGAAVLPACAVGAPHRRDRLWFVARLMGDASVTGLERLGGHGHAATGWTNTTGSATAPSGGAMADTDRIGGQVDPHTGRGAQGSGTREVAGPVCASGGVMADAAIVCKREPYNQDSAITAGRETRPLSGQRSHWDTDRWVKCHDGKVRRVEPSIRLLAHGLSGRVGRLRAYGNAIVPQVAAEFIQAYCES
jgi:DNA (cytosine-5)-methyltransferase 1